jgi:hypothetical protein
MIKIREAKEQLEKDRTFSVETLEKLRSKSSALASSSKIQVHKKRKFKRKKGEMKNRVAKTVLNSAERKKAELENDRRATK